MLLTRKAAREAVPQSRLARTIPIKTLDRRTFLQRSGITVGAGAVALDADASAVPSGDRFMKKDILLALTNPLFTSWPTQYVRAIVPDLAPGEPARLEIDAEGAAFQYTGVTRDGGAVVRGESLAALPSSVLAVMESDRNGGSFRPLSSALLGEWEILSGHAVIGSRTLTIPLEE